jgi:hypothetical protein
VRSTGRLLPLVATLAVAAVLLSGCTGHASDAASSAADARRPAPPLGGPVAPSSTPPARGMDGVERPVAHVLARTIAADGLTLEYLDCPHWDGTVPGRMRCRGYVDGLVAVVRVDVWSGTHRSVRFGARIDEGVVATRRLERTLVRLGSSHPTCGGVPAYPARPGSRIVCRVTRQGRHQYLVATVTDRSGHVRITGYGGPR